MKEKIIHYFSPRKAWIRFFLIITGIGILFWQWIISFGNDYSPKILFLLDNSLSMVVQDIPLKNHSGFLSRFAVAQDFMDDFSKKSPYKIAVMTFARYPTLELPFGSDKELIKNVISGISPVIYGGGSDFMKALEFIKNTYKNTKNINIITLTDAEFFDDFSGDFSFPDSWNIFFVGVGTEKGGFMLQGYDASGKPRYREFQGKNAISSLSKENLEKISQKFSTSFFVIDSEGSKDGIREKIENLGSSTNNHTFGGIISFFAYFLIILGFFINNYPYKKE